MVARPDLDDLDYTLLEHIGRYRISFRCVMERLFSPGSSLSSRLKKLKTAKLIANGQEGKSDFAAWHLTLSGTRVAAVPKDRAEILKRERSLPEAFKILWLCCIAEPTLTRLDDAHVAQILGDQVITRNRFYCANIEDYRLWRIHVPSDRTSVESVLTKIRLDYGEVRALPLAANLLKARKYGSMILVTKPQRANRFKLHLRESGHDKTAPIKTAVVSAWEERHLRLKEWTHDG
ncbi:hypothetical protein GC163_24335 [bacterium]|nr:hypothetical protein [bacterium]